MKPAIHTNCDVVIVPPMEAVWLTGPAFTLHDGRGCLSFEVKGEGMQAVNIVLLDFWWGAFLGSRTRQPWAPRAHPCFFSTATMLPSLEAQRQALAVVFVPCTGDNDATVLLKQQTGSRRWQHLAGGGAAANGAAAANGRGPSPVEQNYTVILGSHRNSCLKFEKDGELCCMVSTLHSGGHPPPPDGAAVLPLACHHRALCLPEH